MDVPETQYAKCGDLSIAHQVVGDGPFDVVFIPGFVSHVELAWELFPSRRMWARLAAFSLLIVFDKRGTGLSDRTELLPTLEERMDDLHAVMDAAGSQRAAFEELERFKGQEIDRTGDGFLAASTVRRPRPSRAQGCAGQVARPRRARMTP